MARRGSGNLARHVLTYGLDRQSGVCGRLREIGLLREGVGLQCEMRSSLAYFGASRRPRGAALNPLLMDRLDTLTTPRRPS